MLNNTTSGFGCYPRELLADQIYCTRENRAALKEKGIKLLAKPLGRPSAVQIHVSPGERNPIEGKVWAGKNRLWLKPHQSETSRNERNVDCLHFSGAKPSQIGGGVALPCLLFDMCKSFFSKIVSIIVKWNIAIVDRLISPGVLIPDSEQV